jgi:D-3-phosphoglycerate dehydrogenase
MFHIKAMNKISLAGLTHFGSSEFSVSDEFENPDAVMVRSASLHEMELPLSLKAVARAGAGYNNIPVDKCSEQGIVVFNTPGANANAVKELVLAAMLCTARNVIDGVAWAKALTGKGDEVPKLVEKGKGKFVGPELSGKKLGVIGLGAIGGMVANTAHSLGMKVYGFDPYISVDAAWGISRSIIKAASYKEIYEKCDFITIHVPVTPETKGILNAETFSAMKRGVRIFNFSRGELVVNNDIIEALSSGQVASYTHDFPCEELLNVKGVISIPHLGASTPESEDNCASMAAEELISFLKTGDIKNSVNFPSAEMPMSTETRITIIHKNIPNMLSQMTSAIGSSNINIENLLNKSKKDYAYTMLDINGDAVDKAVEALKAIQGVIRVRVIR